MCVLCTEDPIDSVDRQVSKVELSSGLEQEPRLGLDPQPSANDVMESRIQITGGPRQMRYMRPRQSSHIMNSHVTSPIVSQNKGIRPVF